MGPHSFNLKSVLFRRGIALGAVTLLSTILFPTLASAGGAVARYCIGTRPVSFGADHCTANGCKKADASAWEKCGGDICVCNAPPSDPNTKGLNEPARKALAQLMKDELEANTKPSEVAYNAAKNHYKSNEEAFADIRDTSAQTLAKSKTSPAARTTPATNPPQGQPATAHPETNAQPEENVEQPPATAPSASAPPSNNTSTTPGTRAAPSAGDVELERLKQYSDSGPSLSKEDSQGVLKSVNEGYQNAHGKSLTAPGDTGGDASAQTSDKLDQNQQQINQATEDGRLDTPEERRKAFKDSGDKDCAFAAGAGYGCKGTQGLIEGAKAVNGLGQAAGSIATAAMGQSGTMRAATAGTQSAALNEAATVQRASGIAQVGAGTTNIAMGVAQLAMMGRHKSVASDFEALRSDAKVDHHGNISGVSGRSLTMAENIKGEMKGVPPQALQKDIQSIARKAQNEHENMKSAAMAGGMVSMITGLSQTAAGGFAIAGANQLKKAAKNLESAEKIQFPTPNFTPLGNVALAPTDPVGDGNRTSLNPNTGTGDQSGASSDAVPSDLGTLGDPVGNPQDNTPSGGPTPGAFTPGGGGGAPPAGGGSGGLGGASTSPSQPDGGDPQAKQADPGKGAGYDGGGGMFGGAGSGAGAGSNGPDLSGLLAQFLPKDKEDKGPGRDILDFGGRNPATDAPISLLDRNANIFERIHETYQEKNRKGRVGL